MEVTLHLGDCLEWLPTLEADSIDSIVCDPPYGLSFMGKDWDHGVPGVAFWVEALRVAKPGAYLLAFGGTRTFHRLTCAIEDAGWEIRDCLMWLYGSGFPKGHSQLKPAWEPIIMARKPVDGTVAANVLRWGTGAINVDACRIEGDGLNARANKDGERGTKKSSYSGGLGNPGRGWNGEAGRWPANLLLDERAAELIDEMCGPSVPRPTKPENILASGDRMKKGLFGMGSAVHSAYYDDNSRVSRFFYVAKASKRDRDEGLDGMEERRFEVANHGMKLERWPDGSLRERVTGPQMARNHHPTVKPTQLMRYLVRLVTPPGGIVLDPFMGSGSTGKAAVLEGFGFIGIELDAEYLEIAKTRIEQATMQMSLELAT